MKKTVLITGINGFIGGNLSKQLLNNGCKVIGITNRKNKSEKGSSITDIILNFLSQNFGLLSAIIYKSIQ